MRRKQWLSIFMILALLLPTLTACALLPKKYTAEGFEWFDTFYLLTVYTGRRTDFDRYAELCRGMMKEYHQLLDIYHTYNGVNNLKTVNDHAGEPVEVEPPLFDFLTFAKKMHELTDGYTNVAMGSVTALWHDAREAVTRGEEARLPDGKVIEAALSHTDIHSLLLDETNQTVTLTDPLCALDAGALGKGYVAQKIADALTEAGCESFLLNMGGNTVARGTKPKNTPWLVGIHTPEGHDGFEESLRLTNESLVTSGSYERCLTVDGVSYHHILHPHTGYPAPAYLSVSVLSDDSAMADALSTALFSMPLETGVALIKSLPQAEAIWMCADGSTIFSDGWESHVAGGAA